MRVLLVLSLLIPLVSLLAASCDGQGSSDDALEFLRETEETGYEGQEVSEERIRELEADIEEYEEDVEEVVRKLGEVTVFRKMLAEEFIDREMYGPALDHLQVAMELQPANAVLYYLAGVSAAQTAQAKIQDQPEQEEFLRLAEDYYLRALELRPRYRECLYAVSVLYVFELEQPAQAEEYLVRLLEIDPENSRARFLRARMLVQTGRLEDAAELYGDIAEDAPSRELRDRALENRNQLLERRN